MTKAAQARISLHEQLMQEFRDGLFDREAMQALRLYFSGLAIVAVYFLKVI